LEEIQSREKTRFHITLPVETQEHVTQFLKNQGFQTREGIELLISYGLSDETDEELKKLEHERETELNRLSQTHATMRFKTYLLSEENCALTMNLNAMLRENRRLKQTLTDGGLSDCFSKDEWDDWDEAQVQDYYQKYVFKRRKDQ
jgi:hypothetical protein